MHQLIVTPGIVLHKRGVGEANSALTILTKELGLVRAIARSTRVEKSKLRFGIEPLTFAKFSFIKGVHEWKLTGAESISSELISETREGRVAAGKIMKLLLRLMHGEEPTEALYRDVYAGLLWIAKAETHDELLNIECVLVLRILSHLGYLPSIPTLAPFVGHGDFSEELILNAQKARPALIKAINESLAQTGL